MAWKKHELLRFTARQPVPDDHPALIYPEWQAEFQAAIIELDPHGLKIRIAAAEALIEKRLHEIANDSDHDLERLAISDALAALRVLKPGGPSRP